MRALKLVQPLLINATRRPVGIHDALIDPPPWWTAASSQIYLIAVQVGIAGMQQPSCPSLHRNTGLTECMPRQRHHQNFGRQAVEAHTVLNPNQGSPLPA